MYKIFTIFIAVIVTTCLAQRAFRYRNKRIPYEDDDYREENDDDRPNDIRDTRPSYDYHSGRFNQMHADMNRQTHFDVGGGRDPPTIPSLYDAYRGYGIPKPGLQSYGIQGIQPQHPSLQSQPHPQPQPQPQPQPTPLSAAPGAAGAYDGGRANAYGYNPYGQYGAYNPYGYRYPSYGWNRPAAAAAPQPTNPWIPFPFNLLLGGGGGAGNAGAYRPWWSGNRWGLFF